MPHVSFLDSTGEAAGVFRMRGERGGEGAASTAAAGVQPLTLCSWGTWDWRMEVSWRLHHGPAPWGYRGPWAEVQSGRLDDQG